jgi:tetratricopeptide (TPR) repeat protein
METKVPFVKQETNWLALIPKVFVIGIFCILFYQFDKRNFFLFAVIVYLILTYIARWLFYPSFVHAGIKHIKEGKFEQAIPFIQKTINYYKGHPWIDKFRFLLLISSAKSTILESSVCNLAYCYLQTGQVEKSTELYQNILRQNPENINARAMLNTINLVMQGGGQN